MNISEQIDKIIAQMPDLQEDQAPPTASICQCCKTEKLDDLIAAGYPRRHVLRLSSLAGASLAKAAELMPMIARKDCMAILSGDRGLGKTQMATYWASQLKYPGLYLKAHDLLEAIKQSYDGNAKQKDHAQTTLNRARNVYYLVLDECSELKGTDWERRTLTNLLDHRYDAMKATVLITNDKPELAAEALGRSVWSRAQETGGVVECSWQSYRGRTKQPKQ